MSSRRSSKGFSLRQPPIVDIGCNCRLLCILFSLFSSHPKPKSTTSYSPSSSTTLTTTTAATTTTTNTWDPPSFTTNSLNEGRPNHSSTKTDQTSYSPSSSTTLTTTMTTMVATTTSTKADQTIPPEKENQEERREFATMAA
ncbi:hypothetical protein FCM35_KLT05717 [Carex littledalei]|uniref:Uncharacterized protein n=1 Tax=Carex littledalei TaxID=544730 RepID=A0A833R2S3_9POAL|nr:hypothetical protein FCM35_KLT05717 [Carex littledalei]